MPAAIANALESHYQPRSAADHIAADDLGRFVALVDRIEMLRSFWSLGLQPTGDKDPFGMRRAALGALRILLETPWHLPLSIVLASSELQTFVLERLRGYLKEQGQSSDVVESVMDCAATQPLHTLSQRIAALTQFKFSPAADSLASAHKRMSQILKKNNVDIDQVANIQADVLQEPSERSLAEHVARLSDTQGGFQTALHTLDFSTALKQLAQIKEPIDAFFDNVMVMADDLTVRQNRLNLLVCISQRMEQIADFSQLN
jgi:glycyl-tRNA synthetase beta chain